MRSDVVVEQKRGKSRRCSRRAKRDAKTKHGDEKTCETSDLRLTRLRTGKHMRQKRMPRPRVVLRSVSASYLPQCPKILHAKLAKPFYSMDRHSFDRLPL